eukprot:GHVS01090229.1.p1 GENE.GHVS01090229.1~~GHVS01090229.1.p1  ORF type:complete len:664 (+),score=147.02 GHVS01090229.1:291-1994(+)
MSSPPPAMLDIRSTFLPAAVQIGGFSRETPPPQGGEEPRGLYGNGGGRDNMMEEGRRRETDDFNVNSRMLSECLREELNVGLMSPLKEEARVDGGSTSSTATSAAACRSVREKMMKFKSFLLYGSAQQQQQPPPPPSSTSIPLSTHFASPISSLASASSFPSDVVKSSPILTPDPTTTTSAVSGRIGPSSFGLNLAPKLSSFACSIPFQPSAQVTRPSSPASSITSPPTPPMPLSSLSCVTYGAPTDLLLPHHHHRASISAEGGVDSTGCRVKRPYPDNDDELNDQPKRLGRPPMEQKGDETRSARRGRGRGSCSNALLRRGMDEQDQIITPSTRYPGVCYSTAKEVWRARITLNGKQHESQFSAKKFGFEEAMWQAVNWRMTKESFQEPEDVVSDQNRTTPDMKRVFSTEITTTLGGPPTPPSRSKSMALPPPLERGCEYLPVTCGLQLAGMDGGGRSHHMPTTNCGLSLPPTNLSNCSLNVLNAAAAASASSSLSSANLHAVTQPAVASCLDNGVSRNPGLALAGGASLGPAMSLVSLGTASSLGNAGMASASGLTLSAQLPSLY